MKCLFLDWKKALTHNQHKEIEMMLSANYKTSICRHWENGHCDKTAEECQFAHGHGERKRHCRFGVTCEHGLKCYYPHHPAEIEYFTLKEQVKPKITREMATQTDSEEFMLATPEDFVAPPPSYELSTILPPLDFRDEPEQKNDRKERSDKGHKLRCGLCGNRGHNRRTCSRK